MSENRPIIVVPPRSRARWVFGALFAAAYLVALLPPIYIGATKVHDVILGLPVSVWYMFGICGFAVGLCAVLYSYEFAREELD